MDGMTRVERMTWWRSIRAAGALSLVGVFGLLSLASAVPARAQSGLDCEIQGFDPPNYEIHEGQPSVSVLVRAGDTDATCVGAVDYETVAGSAEADEDFHPQSGTLTLDDKNDRKYIVVELADDTEKEADEVFRLRLRDPRGAIVGMHAEWATVTIVDDDVTVPPRAAGATGPRASERSEAVLGTEADGPDRVPHRDEPDQSRASGSEESNGPVADRAPTVQGVGDADPDDLASADQGSPDGWAAALIASGLLGGLALVGVAGRRRLRRP